MKVLIVDDNNDKVMEMRKVLLAENVADSDIYTAVSISEAIVFLKKEKYQLMILDMCLPDKHGSSLIDDGGLKLLQILEKDTRLIPPAMAVMLTAHEELLQQYKEEIQKIPFEAIFYDSSSVEWKGKLKDQIKYQIRSENSPAEARKYQYDLAILTAVLVELEAVKKLADHWETVRLENDSTIYWKTEWIEGGKSCSVIMATLPQMGMVAAATVTSKIIFNFSPKYLIMPGIAAGVKNEYEFGDIIVPKEVKDYCSGKYTTPEGEDEDALINPMKYFVPTSLSKSTKEDIINLMANSYSKELEIIHSKWPDNRRYRVPCIHTGDMASGDSVVQNSAIVKSMIKSHLRQADGIDMEAYGMYYAASQAIKPQPITICMKAISDFANKEKSNSHQPYAAFVSANFMKCFVMKELV